MMPSFLSDCSHLVSPAGWELVLVSLLCNVLKESDDKNAVSLVPSSDFLCRYEQRVFATISCHLERGKYFSTSSDEQAFWILDNNKAGSAFEDNSEHFPPQTRFWVSESCSVTSIARSGAWESSPDAVILSSCSVESSDVVVDRDVGIVLCKYILRLPIYFYKLFDFETI